MNFRSHFFGFWTKKAPKSFGGNHPLAPLSAIFSEDRFVDAFGSPLGSFWPPFGSILVGFVSLGVPFLDIFCFLNLQNRESTVAPRWHSHRMNPRRSIFNI
jgi:hypothetical protein